MLNDASTNWLATQSIYKGLQASFEATFGDEMPDGFIDHLESTRVIASSLFTKVKRRTENFFRVRRA